MNWGWIATLLLLSLTAPAHSAVSARDDTGQRVVLPGPARRIVSLAPSTTEMVFAMGAGGGLVGVSSQDDYPPAAKRLPKVGSFSGPDLERIVAARPNVVLAAYGNPQDLIDRLRRRGLPVYVSNPATVAGVLRNMGDLAVLTGRERAARRTLNGMEARLHRVQTRLRREAPVSTLVVIWDEPLTVAGGPSFIQDVLRCAGGINAAGSLTEAYPKLDPERLAALNPEAILFPGASAAQLQQLKSRPGFRQTAAVQSGRVYAPNPDWLMRPGPRVILGVEAVAQLLHPAGAQASGVREASGVKRKTLVRWESRQRASPSHLRLTPDAWRLTAYASCLTPDAYPLTPADGRWGRAG